MFLVQQTWPFQMVSQTVSAKHFFTPSLTVLDDPPFYLKHTTTSNPDSAYAGQLDQASHGHVVPGQPSLLTGPSISRMKSSQSNNEDFRDVIDDLTIQNRKLRKRLKKYETLHSSHLQEEKLFEVRFYGLPAHKKRELDDFLRGFAVSIEDPPERPVLTTSRQQSSSLRGPIPLPSTKKPSSSTTSNSKPVDSAYASMSNSGQTQYSNSHLIDKSTLKKPIQAVQSKQENVKSFLDDMPRGLMPRHSLVMSERSKRKLVVKRLEELFTGKGAASTEHGQSHQQEEVSQSAARADRSALEAGGCQAQVEGLREARISTTDADILTEHMSDASLTSRKGTYERDESVSRDANASHEGTPDQRPTRPLDLDLYRAQVPADNIQYIRHLSLASPTLKTDPYTNTADRWVYLNLLMNMAQLHTFNVTLEFVRKSVIDMSTALELSLDGRKIRWKGGSEGSRLPSDSDSSAEEENCMLLDEGPRGNKIRRIKGNHPNRPRHDIITDLTDVSQYSSAKSAANLGVGTKLRPIFPEHVNNASKFLYKPLFYHGTSSEEGDDYPHDNGPPDGTINGDIGVERTSNTQRSSRARSARGKKGESGPIIFYNKARFCTDLSGDVRAGLWNNTVYSHYSLVPVGSVGPKLQYQASSADDPKGPITGGYMDLDEDTQDAVEPLVVFATTVSQHDDFSHAISMSMEASGLSGVQPMDHFSIDVQVQRMRTNERSLHKTPAYAKPRIRANRLFRNAPSIRGQANTPFVKSTIISVKERQLPPSSLPPPSYIYLQASPSENTQGSNDNENETISVSHSGKRALPSSTADDDSRLAQTISSFGGTREESPYVSSSAVGSDDSSIDLLAHARELDPEAIAAREMEFDRNSRQQLVQVPAGSSAATAGGGSGYASGVSSTVEESRLSRRTRSNAENKTRIDTFSTLERNGSDHDNGSVDAVFTSSGMEESD